MMQVQFATTIELDVTGALTWNEICARYPDQWVCLAQLEYLDAAAQGLTMARLVSHSQDLRDCVRRARDEDPSAIEADEVGYYFTGRRRRPFPSWCLRDDPSRQDPERRRDALAAIRAAVGVRQTPFISEPLSWERICERYPDEWVCLVDMDGKAVSDPACSNGRVVGHSRDLGAALAQSRLFRHQYQGMASFFTGEPRPLPRLVF